MTTSGKRFPLRKWASLAFLLAVAVGLLLGFKTWKTSLENAPVDTSYRDFLSFVATQSPAAELYLKRYYERQARDTVAARDFSQVCASVTALADQDHVDLKNSPWHTLSGACKRPMTEHEIHILP